MSDETLDEVAAELGADRGFGVRVEGRLLRIDAPVSGQPHLATLECLGAVARAGIGGPVGAAAHGAAGVAAAMWDAPNLAICRWTGPSRWVATYRFPARGRPDDYVRDDSGIPSHLARDTWYSDVPDATAEAFFGVGILLDEPPYAVPQPPPKPAKKTAAARAPRAAAAARPRTPRAPKPPPVRKAVPTTRRCPGCNMAKHPAQFEPGSDLCADCR
jgi:hypothetical protein